MSKIQGQISYIEKDYNEFKILIKEDLLIERPVTTTIQILYDKGLFGNYSNADEVSKIFLIVERKTPDLEQVNDNEIQ